MLPVKAGSLILDEDANYRLKSYYQQFCTGENRRRYGLGHIVYACHAALPLVLNADLANLIWLNFNTYRSSGETQRIDLATVSDFLLSPLVRRISDTTFEVIPQIRTFLLYLLNNGQWFELFGIEHFGQSRLDDLASFLYYYVKNVPDSNPSPGVQFNKLNEWAALSYLQPDYLGEELVKELKPLLDERNENEWGQLRIDMLLSQFIQQVNLSIHEPNASKDLLTNLVRYSKANTARLAADSETDLFKLYNAIGKSYLSKEEDDASQSLRLPLQQGMGAKIDRARPSVSTIHPLLIDADYTAVSQKDNSVFLMEELFHFLNELNGRNIGPVLISRQQEITMGTFSHFLSEHAAQLKKRDISFIYLSCESQERDGNDSLIIKNDRNAVNEEPDTWLSAAAMCELIKSKEFYSKQTVLVLNAPISPNSIFVTANNIQISYSSLYLQSDINRVSIKDNFAQWISDILRHSRGQVTYSHLELILRYYADLEASYILPEIQAPLSAWHCQFLTVHPVKSAFRGYLATYNKEENSFDVHLPQFVNPIVNKNARAVTYDMSELIGDGEVFTRYDGKLRFSGANRDRNGKPWPFFKVIPERPYLALVWDLNEKHSKQVYRQIWHQGFDIYSFWEDVDPPNQREIFPYHKNEDHQLRITSVQNTDQFSCEYRTGPPIFWTASNWVELRRTIDKLARYIYLRDIQEMRDNRLIEENEIGYAFSWIPRANFDLTRNDNELMITKDAFEVVDGEVRIQIPILMLKASNAPLYFDVYLLGSDMSISRVTPRDAEKFAVGDRGRMELFKLNDRQKFQKLMEKSRKIDLKILFSTTPIRINFEQSGVNYVEEYAAI
ncbi:hypothetical protein [Chitinophaga flava]|uniref:Uncharacterized protein n=1 Tax=Chitinophaga flava TaxID=2259036 RepID=A0A365Y390_9BACT|nr:hypothetical protein [Chitinophaga flava]RBL93042.1 hypothetical protein DF182_10865 [Chitinophaga flava]